MNVEPLPRTDPPPFPMNAYILTGGMSRRMRRDKALLTLGGRTFIDRTVELAAGLFEKVFTAGKGYGLPLVAGNLEDGLTGIGPLAGIHRALSSSDRDWNFFIGIDYPLASAKLISELARFASFDPGGPDGVVPRARDGFHPLFAFYRRRALPAVERCISAGDHRILCIARHAPVRFVRVPEETPGTSGREANASFLNVNDRSDYERVKKYFFYSCKGFSGATEI